MFSKLNLNSELILFSAELAYKYEGKIKILATHRCFLEKLLADVSSKMEVIFKM